ncbi:MAG: hypothetical protein AAF517_20555 [Planctomycetota bacterium]
MESTPSREKSDEFAEALGVGILSFAAGIGAVLVGAFALLCYAVYAFNGFGGP